MCTGVVRMDSKLYLSFVMYRAFKWFTLSDYLSHICCVQVIDKNKQRYISTVDRFHLRNSYNSLFNVKSGQLLKPSSFSNINSVREPSTDQSTEISTMKHATATLSWFNKLLFYYYCNCWIGWIRSSCVEKLLDIDSEKWNCKRFVRVPVVDIRPLILVPKQKRPVLVQ